VAGAVYDEAGALVGSVAGERAELNLTTESYMRTVAEGLTLQRSVPLAPGSYQVRLAAREGTRSLLGSASQWIEIPDLDRQPLTLSSVFLLADMPLQAGGAPPAAGAAEGGAASSGDRSVADVQIEKTFGPGQGLHYVVHVYAPAGDSPPSVTLQAQVWQGKRLIGVTPRHDLPDSPQGRKWSERIGLDGFRPGDYELRVLATDPATGRTAERRVAFRIEA
jgi:hypothetical protein